MNKLTAILALTILVGSSVFATSDARDYYSRYYRYHAPPYYGHQPYYGYQRHYGYRRPYMYQEYHSPYWWGLDPNIQLELRRDNYRR